MNLKRLGQGPNLNPCQHSKTNLTGAFDSTKPSDKTYSDRSLLLSTQGTCRPLLSRVCNNYVNSKITHFILLTL